MYLYSKDKYPKNYDECFDESYAANIMYRNSSALSRIGVILTILTGLAGFVSACLLFVSALGFVLHLAITALSAIVTYKLFELFSNVLYTLGTIAQSTQVTAKITIYQANRNTDRPE